MTNSVFQLSTLNGSNGFILNGINGDDHSGFSVSSAGDVNADGIDDILIGARYGDPNGTNSGETYVVFGSAQGFAPSLNLSTLNGINGFILNGINASDHSGYSVSSAGDVNADGIDDILIGAYLGDPKGTDSGETYVVFGSAQGFAPSLNLSTLNGINGFIINGINANDQSGLSVSSAGDVNADGIDDILIGAYLGDSNEGDSGESYVVFGSDNGFAPSLNLSALNGSNGFRLNGIDAGDQSGLSVSSAGDVNADGIDDILIGARYGDPNGSNSGESYVVFGSAQGFAPSFDLSALDGSNGFLINGINADDNSGHSVSSAGDINADGIDDILIGAHLGDPNGSNSGETYVVFGNAQGFDRSIHLSLLDGSNGFRLNGINADDHSGVSVSSAGDVNADGIDDIIIGAHLGDPNGANSGETYVVFGSAQGFAPSLNLSTLNGSNGFLINGINANDYSGRSVSSAGDVNADGIDDILIGAYLGDPNGGDSGETYVVFGNARPILDLNGVASGVDATVPEAFLGTTLDLIDASTTFLNDNTGILSGMSLTLVDGEDGFNERLTIDVRGTNITTNYGSHTGVMTLSGVDSVDNYLHVLRTLQYQNIASTPTGTARTVEIIAQDNSNFANMSETATLTFSLAKPSAPTAIVLDSNTIDENSVNNTFIGTLSTIDPNSEDTHTYRLIDDAEGRFAIFGEELVVANGSLLNFEANSSHFIEVETTDNTGLSVSQILTINVNNLAESPNASIILNNPVLTEFNLITGNSQNLGEADTITLDHNVQTITLDHNYNNPVIFAPSVSFNGEQLATPRITNVTSNSFDIYLQEPGNEDGLHSSETLSYFVFEAGTYQLSDGTLVEVGTLDTDATTNSSNRTLTPWETVEFDIDFADTPVIFSQVQTDNEKELVRTRQQNATSNGFEVVMEEDEIQARNGEGRLNETIGYMAIASGSSSSNGVTFLAGSTSDTVTHELSNIDFGGQFNNIPHFLANIATYDGADPSALRFQNLTTNGVQVAVQEDTTFDNETNHTTEVVNYLAFEGDNPLQGTAYDPLTGNRAIIGTDNDEYILGLAENDTLTGKGGSDVFVLEVNQGTDTITDFQLGVDLIGLGDNLTFGSLTLTDTGNDTSVMFNNEVLAIVKGVESTDLNNNDFVQARLS